MHVADVAEMAQNEGFSLADSALGWEACCPPFGSSLVDPSGWKASDYPSDQVPYF